MSPSWSLLSLLLAAAPLRSPPAAEAWPWGAPVEACHRLGPIHVDAEGFHGPAGSGPDTPYTLMTEVTEQVGNPTENKNSMDF